MRAAWQERHDQVLAAGGLHIVGTERHESRRIDNQLRGRSGRQGDPGSSRFYLSMEDNLMRIFGDPNRTKRLLQMAGMKEGEVIESGMLTRQIEKAQRKVESHNFDIRKQLLLFDDVANDQRKVVYQQRTEIMGTEDLSGARSAASCEESVGELDRPVHAQAGVARGVGPAGPGRGRCSATSACSVDPQRWLAAEPELEEPALRARILEAVARRLRREGRAHRRADHAPHREGGHAAEARPALARAPGAMDYLRQGIHLRGYAQKDYRCEYKREAFELFAAMLDRVKFETVSLMAQDRGAHPGGDRARGGGAPRSA